MEMDMGCARMVLGLNKEFWKMRNEEWWVDYARNNRSWI